MHPLQNGSQATVRPAQKPLSGTPGWFTESGDNNVPSYPGADWFNHVIAEFQNMLAATGVDFDPNDDDHLAKAFKGLKKNYINFTTTDLVTAGGFEEGARLCFLDRFGAFFDVVPAGTQVVNGADVIDVGGGYLAVLSKSYNTVYDQYFGVKKVFKEEDLAGMPDQTEAFQAFIDYIRLNRCNGVIGGGVSTFDGEIYYEPDSFQQSCSLKGVGYDPLVTTPDLSNGSILYKRVSGDLFRLNCVKGTTTKKIANGIQHLDWGKFTIMGPAEVEVGDGNGITGIFCRTIRASDFGDISFYQVDRMVEAGEADDYCDYNRFKRIRHRDVYRSGIRIRNNDDGIIDILTNNVNTWNPQDSDDCMVRCYGSFRQKVSFVVGNPPTAATSYLFSRYVGFSDAHSPMVESHNELVDWKVMGVFFDNTTDSSLRGYWRDSTIGVRNVNSLSMDNLTVERVTDAQDLLQIFDTESASPAVEPYVYIGSNAHRITFQDNTQTDVGFSFSKLNPNWGRVKRGQLYLDNGSVRKDSKQGIWAKSLFKTISNDAIGAGTTKIASINVPNVTGGGVVAVEVLTIGATAQTISKSLIEFACYRTANSSCIESSTITLIKEIGTHAITLQLTKSVTNPSGTEVFDIEAVNSGGQTYESVVTEKETIWVGSSVAFIS